MKILIQLLLGVLLLLTCDRPKNLSAEDIVNLSITSAGGLEKWRSAQRLSYTKDFVLFKEDGSVERTVQQTHNFDFRKKEMFVLSVENNEPTEYHFSNGYYYKMRLGDTIPSDPASVEKFFDTALYTVGMPFKLKDVGITFSLEQAANSFSECYALQAAYEPDIIKGESKGDRWIYFIQQTDHKVKGCWVDTGDHYSLIENLTYHQVGGLRFNGLRKSYRSDKSYKKLWLRAQYAYDNFVVE